MRARQVRRLSGRVELSWWFGPKMSVRPLPCRAQPWAVSAESNRARTSVRAAVPLQQAATTRSATAVLALFPMKHLKSRGDFPRYPTAACRYTTRASSRNRRVGRRGKVVTFITVKGRPVGKRAPQDASAEKQRHHGITEPRHTEILSVPVPTRATPGRRSIDARWSLRGGRWRKTPTSRFPAQFLPRNPDAIDFSPLPSSVEPSPIDEPKSPLD